MTHVPMTYFEESELVELLGNRFGNRLVYLQSADDRRLLARAIGLGLVDEEGLLTAAGYRFWQRREQARRRPSDVGRRQHRS